MPTSHLSTRSFMWLSSELLSKTYSRSELKKKKKRKLLAFSTMEEAPVSEDASVSNVSGKRRKRKCKFINCMFYSWL